MASNIFMFTPIWGRWTHFDSYFSKGLKPPTSKPLLIFAPAKKTCLGLGTSSPTRQSLGPLAVSALRQRESAREAGRTWGIQFGERGGLFHKRNLLRGWFLIPRDPITLRQMMRLGCFCYHLRNARYLGSMLPFSEGDWIQGVVNV